MSSKHLFVPEGMDCSKNVGDASKGPVSQHEGVPAGQIWDNLSQSKEMILRKYNSLK